MRVFAIVILVALAACGYDATYADCTISCSTASGCPDGFSCSTSEGLCRSGATTPSCAAILDGGRQSDASGDAPPFSSCNGLAATCGPGANDNCCATATTIPGGTFSRSYDVAGDGMYPNSSYLATVSSFVLDKYEVTVGRFRKFVNSGMGTQASPPAVGSGARALNGMAAQGGWDSSWNGSLSADAQTLKTNVKCSSTYQTWTDTTGANESMPMNCITWYEAFAFCASDGGFLPTEAEWNYAAAGGSEHRAYPWSNPPGSLVIDCSYANYKINTPSGTFCVNGTTGGTNRVGSESPKGDGKWGQSDLAGNVWEWALDWYASPYPMTTCNDCANLTTASARLNRGASFNIVSYLRVAYRAYVTPAFRGVDLGVRCARSAP